MHKDRSISKERGYLMTQLTIPDTVTRLEPFFTSRAHPRELFAQVTDTLLAEDGLLRRVQMAAAHDQTHDVLQATYPEPIVGSQAYGLFNPIRSREGCNWMFARFRSEDVLGRVQTTLKRLLASVDYPLDSLECLLFPVNTASALQMKVYHGLYVLPGAPGQLQVLIWPTAANLTRLDAVLAYALAVNVRAARFGLHTLADWLAATGLAANWVAELHPELPLPWLIEYAQPPGWDDEMRRLADLHNAPDFDAIPTNIYGNRGAFADVIAPKVAPLDADDLEYSDMLFDEALQSQPAITQPVTIAAYLFGDDFVKRQGHPAIGLTALAGLEVSYRRMQAVLRAKGLSAGQALNLRTDEVYA